MSLQPCSGCGGKFLPLDGPTHRYMLSSPACWAAFGRILAAEYSSSELFEVHRLSVDTFAVQHPGDGTRSAIQSVGLHLARLYFQLEQRRSAAEANAFMLRLGVHKFDMPALNPPRSFAVTTADVEPWAGTPEHASMVLRWARTTWDDWAAAHGFIRSWVAARIG